uniref:Putative secreted protein n=1 Tax=Anopheles marajoara TaxID=58244 RepID=A0A2M4CBG9_9DIPT
MVLHFSLFLSFFLFVPLQLTIMKREVYGEICKFVQHKANTNKTKFLSFVPCEEAGCRMRTCFYFAHFYDRLNDMNAQHDRQL